MKFTKFPESVIAPLGDRVTFECEVNVPGERFVWRSKPENDDDQWTDVEEGDGRKIISVLPGRSTKLEVEVVMNMEVTWFQVCGLNRRNSVLIVIAHNKTNRSLNSYRVLYF